MNISDSTDDNSFTLATYSFEGELLDTGSVVTDELASETVEHFQKKLAKLSGDLELPFESDFPDLPFVEYRIGSDLLGAYVLYYFHDEVVFSSLMLSGTEEETETELMQVFKFLHLETSENEEPTEEEIEAVLAASEFDFESIQQRPAVFEVPISNQPEDADQLEKIASMNRHMAAAFFAIER